MKVVHVLSGLDLRFGGPTTALLGLAAAQAQLGLSVSIVATYYQDKPEFDELTRLRCSGVNLELLGPALGPLHRHRSIVPRLEHFIKLTDLVHIHGLWDELQHQAALCAQKYEVPYIVRPCGMLDPWSLNQKRIKKAVYMFWRLRKHLSLADAIHFTSSRERDLATPLRLLTPTIVEPNGFDANEFRHLPPGGSFRSLYPTIASGICIIFLGRLTPKKGLDLLIPAFAQAHQSRASLIIAGPDEGGYAKQLHNWICHYGVERQVLFTGMLTGKSRIAALRDADLFVLPSRQENFGIAVVEALAAGTPVILSDQVNICDMIATAGVGATCRLTVSDLATELNRWISDNELRRSARTKASRFAFANFQWSFIAQRWNSHYQRLCAL